MVKRTVLLTGFAPFGNDVVNPSWEVVKKLQGKNIKGSRIVGLKLPVVFGKVYPVRGANDSEGNRARSSCTSVTVASNGASSMLISAISKHKPDLVLMLGQNANAPVIYLERVGLNIHSGCDENKKTPESEFIIDNAPAAYFATLPFKNILARARTSGIPMNISYHAGTYLCNEVLYTTLHYISEHKLPTRAGFVHLPMLVEQVARKNISYPSMTLETMVMGVRLIIETCVEKRGNAQ